MRRFGKILCLLVGALGVTTGQAAVVAGMETAEVTKLLLGGEASLQGRVLHIDLSTMKVVQARL